MTKWIYRAINQNVQECLFHPEVSPVPKCLFVYSHIHLIHLCPFWSAKAHLSSGFRQLLRVSNQWSTDQDIRFPTFTSGRNYPPLEGSKEDFCKRSISMDAGQLHLLIKPPTPDNAHVFGGNSTQAAHYTSI